MTIPNLGSLDPATHTETPFGVFEDSLVIDGGGEQIRLGFAGVSGRSCFLNFF